jgi:hypothetical protein
MIERRERILSTTAPSPKNPNPTINVEEYFRLFIETVKDYAIFMLDSQGKVTS